MIDVIIAIALLCHNISDKKELECQKYYVKCMDGANIKKEWLYLDEKLKACVINREIKGSFK